MTERLDALTVRESNGKSYFTKIGASFPNRDGKALRSCSTPCPPRVRANTRSCSASRFPRMASASSRRVAAVIGTMAAIHPSSAGALHPTAGGAA